MLISVVIPAWNEEKYLPACLDALQRQDFRGDFEIVVVDNDSSDGTAATARAKGARVVHETRRGIGASRAAGARAAHGEILAATDADCMPARDWLARIVRWMEQDPDCVLLYGPSPFYEGNAFDSFYNNRFIPILLSTSARAGRPLALGNNHAVRRDALLRAGSYRADLPSGEDADVSLRVGREGRSRYDPDLVVYTSARRMREGYHRILLRTMRTGVRMARGQTPLPLPPIR